MDVRRVLRTVAPLTFVICSGCMNPGYQYLNPPGFSSTAHRVQMQHQRQRDLEMAQLMSQYQPDFPQEAKKSLPQTAKTHWSKYWPNVVSVESLQPKVVTTPAIAEPQREKTRFSGWAERPLTPQTRQ